MRYCRMSDRKALLLVPEGKIYIGVSLYLISPTLLSPIVCASSIISDILSAQRDKMIRVHLHTL